MPTTTASASTPPRVARTCARRPRRRARFRPVRLPAPRASSGPRRDRPRPKRRLVAPRTPLPRTSRGGGHVRPPAIRTRAPPPSRDPVASVSFASGRPRRHRRRLAAVLSADAPQGNGCTSLCSRAAGRRQRSVSRTLSSLAWSRDPDSRRSPGGDDVSESDAVEIIDVFAIDANDGVRVGVAVGVRVRIGRGGGRTRRGAPGRFLLPRRGDVCRVDRGDDVASGTRDAPAENPAPARRPPRTRNLPCTACG